jgi:HlyD family secretion protein
MSTETSTDVTNPILRRPPAVIVEPVVPERRRADAADGPSLRTPVIAGLTAIGIGFGGFFGWAFQARLDSAAVAAATVIVDSKRKTVSHLEGGILKSLLVREGETVRVGQGLLRLDDTRARAELLQLRGRRVGLEARIARLKAEQSGAKEVDFRDILERSDPRIAEGVVTAERKLFAARQQELEGKVDIQQKVIEQAEAEAAALVAQIDATARQKQIVDEELAIMQGLYDKRYAKRSQVSDLQGRQSELQGRAGEYAARKAKAEQAVAGARLEILSIGTARQREIADDMQTSQLALMEVIEQITAAEDILKRVELTSPQDGIVTEIRFRTPGGVIRPGEPILDIVPENEPLIIEGRISPKDIDSVRVGSETQVRLTAFSARLMAPLQARVTYVAADQQVDDRTGTSYFTVRAEILPESLAASHVILYPGMPADMIVLNGSRRAIDYLIAPISESFNRAFRED